MEASDSISMHEQLETVVGDLSDASAVSAAVEDAHAVICVAGSRPESAPGPLTEAVPTMVAACRKYGVTKLIMLSCGLAAAPGEWWGLLTSARLARSVVRWQLGSNILDDNERVMHYLYNDVRDLDWVVARPPTLEEGDGKGAVQPCLDPWRPAALRYCDVADWLLAQVDSDAHVGKMPRLYYGSVDQPL
eukprot:TRINITY_DN21135_c0_g1_i2.p1 TRINITY_DN21135_c0_g1~~TRINITY_DN21135_c0_g1_i2.p1  ORF type:complete len:190 (-),score=10.02 TRINITY_DN21135_c0_g1_i2:10-579(-)